MFPGFSKENFAIFIDPIYRSRPPSYVPSNSFPGNCSYYAATVDEGPPAHRRFVTFLIGYLASHPLFCPPLRRSSGTQMLFFFWCFPAKCIDPCLPPLFRFKLGFALSCFSCESVEPVSEVSWAFAPWDPVFYFPHAPPRYPRVLPDITLSVSFFPCSPSLPKRPPVRTPATETNNRCQR